MRRWWCRLRGHPAGAWLIHTAPGLATYTRTCRCGERQELEERRLQYPVRR